MELISIHALREEGDPDSACPTGFGNQFLSTPSARRATIAAAKDRIDILTISIHALREEGDTEDAVLLLYDTKFLSTPSARRATRSCPKWSGCPKISIHALREEGDPEPDPDHGCQAISIHALREEGDLFFCSIYSQMRVFLSTPSARRATHRVLVLCQLADISIHALREEGDRAMPFFVKTDSLFLSTPSARRATRWPLPPTTASGYFYPRPPRGGRQNSAV